MTPAHITRLMTFAQHGQPKDYGGSDMMRGDLEALILAKAEAVAAGNVQTVYVYRQPDGVTQVRAPHINDPALVVDMLTEGLRAMSDGSPVVTQ